MKKILFLIAVLYSGLLLGQDSKTPYQTKSLTSDNIKEVEVETSGGSISVTGGDANYRVEMYITPNGNRENSLSKDEIEKRIAEDYDITLTASGGKLTAIAKPKKRNMDWRRALNISFKVFVAKNVSTELRTSGGSIHLAHLAGTQDFATSGGSLHLDDLSGKVDGTTSGGSIHLSNSKDRIKLTTSGGSIDAENCDGDLILHTSGGSVELNNLKGNIDAATSGGSIRGRTVSGELKAHTSGGNVNLRDMHCSIETGTSGGNIDVEITALGKYVRIGNSGGNIDLQLPSGKGLDLDLSSGRIKTDKMSNFSGSVEDDRINGKINGGGVPVRVDGGSGRLTVTFK
jgi:DUF4097 and DUF4098 domain-containing protein YvlB